MGKLDIVPLAVTYRRAIAQNYCALLMIDLFTLNLLLFLVIICVVLLFLFLFDA